MRSDYLLLRKKIETAYIIHVILYILLIIFAFFANSPTEILSGLIKIIINSDILITDYIYLAGIGATFINLSLLGLLCIYFFIHFNCKASGRTIMALWLLTGFAMFGKNIFNVWPILIGVWLYSKFKDEPLSKYIVTAILGTSLAPTVSLFSFFSGVHIMLGLLIGFLVGICIGFILPPIAEHCINVHFGFNLYNIGFAGGIIAMAVTSLLRAVGHDFDIRLLWYSGNNTIFALIMFGISIYFIFCSLIIGKDRKKIFSDFKSINNSHGKMPSDFFFNYNSSCYFNMGLLGLISTSFVLLIKGDLNGPTMGAIFTMIGFGCFGKNIINVIPVMIGASLAAIVSISAINSPSTVVAIMFSTGLAPISGYFGWKYGIIAGFIHVFIVSNVGYMHGGLNLYNNGLACGFVAMLMIPVIASIKNIDLKIFR
ncbi:DUF1576 domain-containing protein [Clostridium tarantellae]|uniref:DUF1576 domain-containing protein n=1 Tax=Clostridium tarantellae TaxID=39493 RepID=A0A6I1MP71_9CLOT|nr:DUF1576 domain-containing protein [Clostridium tarantellae]MPQ44730.1 DUF1576 domain-containing protein [Clostridium tarantellae]